MRSARARVSSSSVFQNFPRSQESVSLFIRKVELIQSQIALRPTKNAESIILCVRQQRNGVKQLSV